MARYLLLICTLLVFACKKPNKKSSSQAVEVPNANDAAAADDQSLVDQAMANDTNLITDLSEYLSLYQIVPEKTLKETIDQDVLEKGIKPEESEISQYTVTLEDLQNFSDAEKKSLHDYTEQVHSRLLVDYDKASTDLEIWYYMAHYTGSSIADLYQLIFKNELDSQANPDIFNSYLANADRDRILAFFEPYITPTLFLDESERSDQALQEDYLDFKYLDILSFVEGAEEKVESVKGNILANYSFAEDPLVALEDFLSGKVSESELSDFQLSGAIAAYARFIMDNKKPKDPLVLLENRNGLPVLAGAGDAAEEQGLQLTSPNLGIKDQKIKTPEIKTQEIKTQEIKTQEIKKSTIAIPDKPKIIKNFEADSFFAKNLEKLSPSKIPFFRKLTEKLSSNIEKLNSSNFSEVKKAYKEWKTQFDEVRYMGSEGSKHEFFSISEKGVGERQNFSRNFVEGKAVTDATVKIKISDDAKFKSDQANLLGMIDEGGKKFAVYEKMDNGKMKTFKAEMKDIGGENGNPPNTWKIIREENGKETNSAEIKSRQNLADESREALVEAYYKNKEKPTPLEVEKALRNLDSFFYTKYAWGASTKYLKLAGNYSAEGVLMVPRFTAWLTKNILKLPFAIVDAPLVLLNRYIQGVVKEAKAQGAKELAGNVGKDVAALGAKMNTLKGKALEMKAKLKDTEAELAKIKAESASLQKENEKLTAALSRDVKTRKSQQQLNTLRKGQRVLNSAK